MTSPSPSGILFLGMPANANTLPTAPASRNVREFLAVCARHNVPCGDLNCLPALLRELGVNKHFAMHFWSAVAGITEKQSAGTDTVLTAITEAVTGRTIEEVRDAGPSHRILLERLQGMLNGQDVPTDELKEVNQAVPAEPLAAIPQATPPTNHPSEERILPMRSSTRPSRSAESKRAARKERNLAAAAAAEDSARLVLMPEPEAIPHRRASEPASYPSRATTAMPADEPLLAGRSARGAAPLSSYAESAPRRSIAAGPVIGVLVVLFLAGAGYVVSRSGGWERVKTATHAGYDSAVTAWHGEPTKSAAPEAAAAPPAAVAPPVTPATKTPAIPSAAAGPIASAPENSNPAASVSRAPREAAPLPQPSREPLTPEQRMAVEAARQDRTPPAVIPIPDVTSGEEVKVPETTMNSHLVISRVPIIPESVRQSGLTGVVRLQAHISRAGSVTGLHVLDGPQELRQPALDAVSAWRYRPYMVNGQPTDVTTTITVDFSSL